jgi:hypothetical protein
MHTHLKLFIFASLGVLCLLGPGSVFAHPVPDGVVFRGIQVVVWSQRIEIRYQVGLSDNMVQQELRALLPTGAEIPEEPGQALRVYRDVMFPRLPGKILVTIDRQPQVLEMRRTEIVRQHHIQIELVYRIDYTVPLKPVYFLLVDDNFQGIPGYHLAAIKGRGLVDVPEANAVSVLSRLSREPETEEDLRILSTPVRRVEAMIAAIAADDPPGTLVETTSAASPPVAAVPPAAPVPHPTDQEDPAIDNGREETGPATSSDRENADFHGLIWPAAGCLLILAALVWLAFVVRRS